jgi:hypothetical protein
MRLLLCFLCAAVWASPNTFFDQHCLECHDSDVRKGGLDLETLSLDMGGSEAVDRWTLIYDRIAAGEMPPPKKARPAKAEIDQLFAWITPRLSPADQAQREVVQRRLNRREYSHSIQDLLAIDLDLSPLLPQDQLAGGFDTNGAALAVSSAHMKRYLQAAERAIDAAIAPEKQPQTQSFTVKSLREVRQYLPQKRYSYSDSRVVTYTSNKSQYSKIATRDKRLPSAGRYRFDFEAKAYYSDRPIVFSVTASDFRPVTATFRKLGYFEASPKAKRFSIEAMLPAKSAIQFFVHGLPTWINKPVIGENPGVGFGAVTITGPLNESWPPPSHHALFGPHDPQDLHAVLARFMPRAFRRPVSAQEIARYAALGDTRQALVALLCSPNFLYLRELDGPRITGHEFANRLAYFLWRSMPDEPLLAADLDDSAVLRAQVHRLLADPKSERFVHDFTDQWLHLRDIDATTPDRKLYPDFDELLKISMLRESRAFFRHLLHENLSLHNFISADFAMLNGRLARHYGIPGVEGLAMRPVALPTGSVRGGVLTQAAVLKVTANGTHSSPVTRGVWVLENILGRPTPPPPPNIAGIEPDIRGATTIREQLAAHRDSASCAPCHRRIDPPGFALESFDPVGKFREHYRRFQVNPKHADKGWGRVVQAAPVDATGVLPNGAEFANIREFKALLRAEPAEFASGLTRKLMSFGLGRELGFSDRPAIAAIVANSAKDGDGFRDLILSIVSSDSFRQR